MNCPQCGGDVWNNVAANDARAQAGEKLRPDYFCKDKNCGWLQWRPKQPFQGFQGTPPNAPKPPVMKPVDNGGCKDVKSDMMRLAYRKDLAIAVLNKFGDTTDLKAMAEDLWSWIEK